ncbi:MAG: prepilin-type N-terminal cleavage/methylation domain-containing protein [Eubacteriales bacterium]|nr:prepilin-type N-terminal cleavage/methylation domain-containing protein [Eubacteriales bacterium]
MEQKRKNKKGFTLIELIVVIAVLAILAAVAIPNFVGMSDRAKKGVCTANISAVRTLYIATVVLDGDNSDAHLQKVLAEQTSQDGCPCAGEYHLTDPDNFGITCSYHKEEVSGQITLSSGLDIQKAIYSAIGRLLKTEDGTYKLTNHIDSTAIDSSTAGLKGTATAVRDLLKEKGISVDCAWSVVTQDNKVRAIYVMEGYTNDDLNALKSGQYLLGKQYVFDAQGNIEKTVENCKCWAKVYDDGHVGLNNVVK